MAENDPVLGRYGKYVEVTDISEIANATSYHKSILDDVDSNYSQIGHTHTKSDITDFSHTHTQSEITDLSFEWEQITDSGITRGILYVNPILRLANYVWSGTISGGSGNNGTIPEDYRPLTNVSGLLGYSANNFIRVNTDGEIRYNVPSSSLVLATSLFWRY